MFLMIFQKYRDGLSIARHFRLENGDHIASTSAD